MITQVTIPSLVRVKCGAIDRLGLYLKRSEHTPVLLLVSQGLVPDYLGRVHQSLALNEIDCFETFEVADASFENAMDVFTRMPKKVKAVVGLGGGKALDVAKYVAFLARLPYYAVPTSLSNDGFSSPQSSLTIAGRRRSLAAALPFAVVLDLDVCQGAPRPLWLSGVGDLVSKLTAIFDWKLAFFRRGEPVNDFAALLSDATVYQFLAQPSFDLDGARLLGTALLFNGIAMEICGSSRPASGSEHLISHALDAICKTSPPARAASGSGDIPDQPGAEEPERTNRQPLRPRGILVGDPLGPIFTTGVARGAPPRADDQGRSLHDPLGSRCHRGRRAGTRS